MPISRIKKKRGGTDGEVDGIDVSARWRGRITVETTRITFSQHQPHQPSPSPSSSITFNDAILVRLSPVLALTRGLLSLLEAPIIFPQKPDAFASLAAPPGVAPGKPSLGSSSARSLSLSSLTSTTKPQSLSCRYCLQAPELRAVSSKWLPVMTSLCLFLRPARPRNVEFRRLGALPSSRHD